MRSLVFALVLVLLVAGGTALDCYHCQPNKAGGACEITTLTCPAEKDACVSAKFLRSPYGHYQKCTTMAACDLLKLNAYMRVKCCQGDLCNTM
ncbi:CD59 glycoprotein isoform 1-T2 [Clarias gariepinus]|uniref:CD59 glycoprotein n=1 Tax=Clarias gariepinus TaxID=13013 RepID=UPI00234D7405|nr:CD59 glycoprotein [Clarias gariepinus]XP_053342996.1 CD59 glycoprotein [Clarias gariepinus]